MNFENSPLNKIKREPKLYVDLPSGGNYYAPGLLSKANELAVYSMTARDEMTANTPDALYTGLASTEILKRCMPDLKNPHLMPMLDVQFCLASVRLASYGNKITFNTKCPKCSTESSYELELQKLIDHFKNIEFKNSVVVDQIEAILRPLTFKEHSELARRNFIITRQMIIQGPKITDEEEKGKVFQDSYDQLAKIRVEAVSKQIEKIVIDGEEETNHNLIVQWLQDNDKEYNKAIEEVIIANQKTMDIPSMNVECTNEECKAEFELPMDLDYSNFFVKHL